MASNEQGQTHVLKVSIHCEGCKKKVKKILRNIHGVESVDIDTQQNKVTVTGEVDADALIQRLAKSGKHADMWPENKPTKPSSNPKAKDKEKSPEKTTESNNNKKKKNLPAADASTATNKTPDVTPSESDTKPRDTETSKKSDKEVADTDSESDTDTKPAEPAGKQKGKKQAEPRSSTDTEEHSRNLPYQVPVYQHHAYAVSHDTAHRMPSHSYYYPPVHSGYNYNYPPPPQPHQHQQPNYNHYVSSMESRPQPSYNYYASSMESRPTYSYYESSVEQRPYSYYEPPQEPRPASSSYSYDPRASPSRGYNARQGGGLDMFSDENPNACKIM